MKLEDNNLLFIVNSVDFRKHHLKHLEINKSKNLFHYENMKNFFETTGFRKLVLSNKAIDLLQYYKVPSEFKFDFMRTLPNRKDSILISNKGVIKYMKNDDLLIVSQSIYGTDHLTRTNNLIVDLKQEKILLSVDQSNSLNDSQKISSQIYYEFTVLISFLELSEVELKILKPKQKIGSSINPTGYVNNNSRFDVIHVNSNWNVETITIGNIKVSGHFRLQPYGPRDNRHYKNIFIKPYTKGHTRRLSQKEIIENRFKDVS